jgi:hypothetical protein
MEYEIYLTSKAESEFNALPVWLQGIVESHLLELAKSPSALSRRVVSPPYPPGGMMYEFSHGPIDGTLHRFAVFFRYSQDETRLVVFAIGYSPHLAIGSD